MSKNFQKQLQKKFEADRKRKLAKRSPSPSPAPAPEEKPQTQEQIRAQIAIRDGFSVVGTVEEFGVRHTKGENTCPENSMNVRPRYERAADMERGMLTDLKKEGLPAPSKLHEYFCPDCGGVVVISSTKLSGEKEFECNDCGLTKCLRICYLREVLIQFPFHELKASDEPQPFGLESS